MDYSGILSNAERLKKASAFRVLISEQVKDILYGINSAITDAHTIGLSKIEYKLPINFKSSDENISNTMIQTNVYYKIISELERMNYKVSLEFLKKYTMVHIEWTVKTDDDELKAMQRKLLSLQLHNNET